jgi:hypothetical protein
MAAKQNPTKKPVSHKKRAKTAVIKALHKQQHAEAQTISRAQRAGCPKLWGERYGLPKE